jgi:short-subunit dehydrogenase
MKYQIPEMLKSGNGSIVNISSILGQVGFEERPLIPPPNMLWSV